MKEEGPWTSKKATLDNDWLLWSGRRILVLGRQHRRSRWPPRGNPTVLVLLGRLTYFRYPRFQRSETVPVYVAMLTFLPGAIQGRNEIRGITIAM